MEDFETWNRRDFVISVNGMIFMCLIDESSGSHTPGLELLPKGGLPYDGTVIQQKSSKMKPHRICIKAGEMLAWKDQTVA